MKKVCNYIIYKVKETVKKCWIAYFIAFICLLCSIYLHVSFPSHYDSRKIDTVTDTCVSIEERIEKRLNFQRGKAFDYFTYMELHMSDGKIYYVTENYESIFDIDKLKDGLNEKLLTLNCLSSADNNGYVLLSVEDQFGNVYLSRDDVENANRNFNFKMDIIWFVLIALCTLFPLSFAIPDIFTNIRQKKKKREKKEKQFARQQRYLEDPDSFKNAKNKKK